MLFSYLNTFPDLALLFIAEILRQVDEIVNTKPRKKHFYIKACEDSRTLQRERLSTFLVWQGRF